jgi:hypothetical protein
MQERVVSRERVARPAREEDDFSDVVLPSKADAEGVIDGLRILTKKFGFASVADYYDLVGIKNNYVDAMWGWRKNDLNEVSITEIPDGCVLVLPAAKKLT